MCLYCHYQLLCACHAWVVAVNVSRCVTIYGSSLNVAMICDGLLHCDLLLRYPTFIDAVRDLDDAISMCCLFSTLPQMPSAQNYHIHLCRRLTGRCFWPVLSQAFLFIRSLLTAIPRVTLYLQLSKLHEISTWRIICSLVTSNIVICLIPVEFMHYVISSQSLRKVRYFFIRYKSLVLSLVVDAKK